MSLKSFGEWLRQNMPVSTEEEIVQSLMERRARGQVEEPDELYDDAPAGKLHVHAPRKTTRKRRPSLISPA